MTDDLQLAHQLADLADEITLGHFLSDELKSSLKADQTVVTEADRRAEAAIRQSLSNHRPSDAVQGEEMADTGSSNRHWVIDPIDGTANYIRGVPIWATLIALMNDDHVEVGLVSAPALGRRWWASIGHGAWTGGALATARQLSVSPIDQLSQAFISYSSLAAWAAIGRQEQFTGLLQRCGRTRAFGDFYSYMLVAEGAVEIATEPELALHDMAALDVIITEAGGSFTNLDGHLGPVGPGALATNGFLQTQALESLAA